MKIKDFVNRCEKSGYEVSEGRYNQKEGYFVNSKEFDTRTHFLESAVLDNEWGVLNKSVVQGKNVSHITRIVGYFSKIENWNQSKRGELKDRHQGKYSIK